MKKTDKTPRCYYCGATHQPEGGPLLHTQVRTTLPIGGYAYRTLMWARICDGCAWVTPSRSPRAAR